MAEELITEHRGPAVILTINRPERRNAMTADVIRALTAAVTAIDVARTRLVVLTGTPPAFCAGGDLRFGMSVASEGGAAATELVYKSGHASIRALHDCPVPVLAAVNGPALGGGLDLALACDLRIATPEARFASSWVRMGLVPATGGAHALPRIVGAGRAAEMLLLGRAIGADVALAWGLVSEIVEAPGLPGRIDAIAAEVAALPEAAVRLTKATFRRELDDGLDAELDILAGQQGELLTSEEFRARAARFARPPGPSS